MDVFKYSKEEREKLKKSMSLILDDLRELWSTSQQEEVTISFPYFEVGDALYASIVINDKEIYLKGEGLFVDLFHLEKKSFVSKKSDKYLSNNAINFYFIQRYEGIRKELKRKITKGLSIKSNGLEQADDYIKRYEKEATIEVNLPVTNNPHTINIKEENGQKIGELNFGYATIKLITKGNIILVNEEKDKKIKKKNDGKSHETT